MKNKNQPSQNLKIKFKEVYMPYLFVSVGIILFYNLLRWIFDIKLGILPLKKDLLDYWIPIAITWLSVLIWLRRRIRILSVRGSRDNGYFLYQLAMIAGIAVPLIISQKYIEKAFYSLTEINNANEVREYPNEKYFKIKSYEINMGFHPYYGTSRASGKNNENLQLYIYFVSPFEDSPNIWYGEEYSKRVSNRLSPQQKNAEYFSLLSISEIEYEAKNPQNIQYFERVGYSDELDGFMEAIQDMGNPKANNDKIILTPKTANFDHRLSGTFSSFLFSYIIGSIIVLAMILIPKIDKNGLRDLRKNRPIYNDDLKDILELLDPTGPIKGMAILVLLNIVVFVVMTFMGINIMSPTGKELLDIGANRRFEVMNGEYWRLLTSVFIHGGIMHLFMNLVGLVFGGVLLENILGWVRLLIIYIICGILASLGSIYWHENTVSVGASGAIFGLYGLILAFTIFKIYPKNMRGMSWFVLGLYAGVSLLYGLTGGIDNAAHLTGLISGFIIGALMVLIDRDELMKNAKN